MPVGAIACNLPSDSCRCKHSRCTHGLRIRASNWPGCTARCCRRRCLTAARISATVGSDTFETDSRCCGHDGQKSTRLPLSGKERQRLCAGGIWARRAGPPARRDGENVVRGDLTFIPFAPTTARLLVKSRHVALLLIVGFELIIFAEPQSRTTPSPRASRGERPFRRPLRRLRWLRLGL